MLFVPWASHELCPARLHFLSPQGDAGAWTGKLSLLSQRPAPSLALRCLVSVELLNRQMDDQHPELPSIILPAGGTQ